MKTNGPKSADGDREERKLEEIIPEASKSLTARPTKRDNEE